MPADPDDVPLTPSSPAALQGLLLSLLLYILCNYFDIAPIFNNSFC